MNARFGNVLIVCSALIACACFAARGAEPRTLSATQGKADESGKVWYDIRQLGLEGQGWTEVKAPFDRLPAKAESQVRPPVWGLSRDSAGLCVRFTTDATDIACRWTLIKANLALPHMAATGVSGVDLYVSMDGKWRWLATGRPANAGLNQTTFVSNLPSGTRNYMLYLPLYNGVTAVEIGLSKGASLATLPRAAGKDKPIVFYGTSITQGGCASRTGMVHTAILGRRLDRPVINLGFSGNGRMEAEVAALLAELDPAIYVIDCLPNMLAAEVTERTGPLVATLRKAHPETPIVLVEDRTYANAFLVEAQRKRNETSRSALRSVYDKLIAGGEKNVHYLRGDLLLNEDGEGTVDGSHPTDLGFVQHADAFEKVLRPLVK